MANKYATTNFDSSGVPLHGRVNRPVGGAAMSVGSITDLSTGLNDFNGFLAVPAGTLLAFVAVDLADADTDGSPTATGQIVLRRVVNGVTTDTVLVDLDTGVQAAHKAFYIVNQAVADDDNGYGIVGVLFDAAATTAGTGANKVTGFWF